MLLAGDVQLLPGAMAPVHVAVALEDKHLNNKNSPPLSFYFYTIIWYGMSLWSVWASCPSCVSLASLLHTLGLLAFVGGVGETALMSPEHGPPGAQHWSGLSHCGYEHKAQLFGC